MESLNLVAAVVGGLLSFFSPCVLPLIPIYISILSGLSHQELVAAARERKTALLVRIFAQALMFVAGFSSAFILLGASASLVGQWLSEYRTWFIQVGGILVILFGLYFLGLFRFPRWSLGGLWNWRPRSMNAAGALLMGFVFAVAWTPCVSYVLAGILTLAADEAQVWKGVILLTVYSLGLGIPFLVTAVAFGSMVSFFKKVRVWLPVIEKASGVFLIVLGLLLVAGEFTALTARLARLGVWLGQ
ncbi:MAG: cytochrome c biogenesis protein CcdA [Acidobacteria bacterium]|nr:cytochrome c biogenesis protein CcdA [Acidobacteriota bacterium]MDW7984005.1 cytochrome c biogenesis protein CcdA [Acidobacteriota bacterium]